MELHQVAIQLYTLRDFTRTPQEIATTLRKVRAIGYEAVQASAMGPIAEEELLKILDGEGLTLCATHEPSDLILIDPGRVVDRLHKLKCKYTAYPVAKDVDFASGASVDEWLARLNRAGRILHEAGQILTYHNHQHEFRRLEGKTILEHVFERTDPRYLQGELDTYWIQFGGGDPVAWCEKLRQRLPVLHIKDYVVTEKSEVTFGEIGSGNLDFPRIIEAAERSGCEWFIVEQDTCPGDPFDSIRQSFDFIKENLVSKPARFS